MFRTRRCSKLYTTFICYLFAIIFNTAQGQIISQSVTKLEEHVNEYSVPDLDANVSGSSLSFMELVRQRTVGNPVEQCPCVVLSGSNRCITYDARFQASNLEEAITAFVDTSLVDRTQGNLPITPATFECNTEECRQCAGILAVRLRQIGLLRGSLSFPFALPTESVLKTLSCPRLRISRPIPTKTPPQNAPTSVENLISAAAPLRAEFDRAPKSSFARTVEEAIMDGRAADGQPLISRFIASPSSSNNNQRSAVSNGNKANSPFPPSPPTTPRPSVNTPRVSFPAPKLLPARLLVGQAAPANTKSSSSPPAPNNRPVGTRTQTNVVDSQRFPASQAPNSFPPQVVDNTRIRSNLPINTPPNSAPQLQTVQPQAPITSPAQFPPRSSQTQSTSTNQGQVLMSPISNMARTVPRPLMQRLRNNVRNQVFQRLNQPNTPWQQGPRSQQPATPLTPQPQNSATPQLRPQFKQQPQSQFIQPQSQPQVGIPVVQGPLVQQTIQQSLQQQQQGQWQPQQQGINQQGNNWQWSTVNDPSVQPVAFQQQQQPFGTQQQLVTNANNYPSNTATNWVDSSNGLVSNWQNGGQGNGINQPGNGFNMQQTPQGQQQFSFNNPTSQIGNSAVGEVQNNLIPSQQNSNAQFGSPGLPNPTGEGVGSGGQPQGQQQGQQQIAGLTASLGTGISFSKRAKRANEENIIGDRFVINCVERGDPENENTDFLNLCTACWTWRQLPENYFPRLINELVCQENDYCLSGWGSCHQRYRNVDVLRRVGNDWRPTTISTASCCDCKVKAGSQIHPLVVGKNKR